MRTMISTDSALGQRSVDVLLERYVAWREECNAVREAYESWAGSGREQRRLAYADYVAALDCEERAADAYAQQIERVRQNGI